MCDIILFEKFEFDEEVDLRWIYMCKELLECDLATDEGKKYAMEKQLFVEFCPKMVESATMITEKLLNR